MGGNESQTQELELPGLRKAGALTISERRKDPVPPSSGPITPRSRGEATQALFAMGFEFNLCVEAIKRFGNDVDGAANWLRSQSVEPGSNTRKPPPGMSEKKAGKQPMRAS